MRIVLPIVLGLSTVTAVAQAPLGPYRRAVVRGGDEPGVRYSSGLTVCDEALRDGHSRMEIHGNAQEVRIGANGEVVGHDEDGCGEFLAIRSLALKFNRHQGPKKIRNIALGDFSQDRCFPFLGVHARNIPDKLRPGEIL